MEERINDRIRKEQNKLPKPDKSGGDMQYRAEAQKYKSGWVRRQRYSWGEIIVERRYSSTTEWVHVEPTTNQPNSILISARRTRQRAAGLRYQAALYVNKRIQLRFEALRQPIEFYQWLQMCIDFGLRTRREYSDELYTLRYIVDNFPEWKIGGMTMPEYDENGEQVK